jgi:O-antigen/teichoic acid export membrane protein
MILLLANATVAILLVRVVPVHDYGIYSYAMALSSIGIAVMTAGLSGLAVKALVNDRGANAVIMTTLVVTRELFAVIGYGLIALVSLTSGDSLVVAASLIAALALFSRASDAPEMWFLSNLQSKYTALTRVGVTVTLFVIRLALLATGQSIWVFLWIYVLESILASGLILLLYVRWRKSPGFAAPSSQPFGMLLRSSWPLLLSSIAGQVNMKGDLIYVQALLGSTAVGLYSAAARLSELAYFLPTAFMNATLPHLLHTRKLHGSESTDYRLLLQRSYDRAFWVGVAVAVAVAVVGPIFIDIVFGPRYAESKAVLLIHVLACPFVFMAAVYSKWIIAEGVLWSSFVRHSAGVIVNITLNFSLIPIWGIRGAAIATVASYVTASYLATLFGSRSREAGLQMTLAIIWPLRIVFDQLIRRRGRGHASD